MNEWSSAASSSSSALSCSAKDGDGGEVEVARVLAKLGNTAADTPYWGSKRKRSSKRVKTKSDQTEPSQSSGSGSGSGSGLGLGLDLGLTLNSTVVPLPFDLNVVLDEVALDVEEYGSPSVDLQKFCQPAQESPAGCALRNVGRSRQNLTEEEKEERRLRRVLANRESARQTIRRRQAEHQELTQKAAILASENEDLKRRKETVLMELESLHITNQNLKEKIGENHKHEEVSYARLNQTFFMYNTANPFMIFPWPWFVPVVPNNANDPSSIMRNLCSWGSAVTAGAAAAAGAADREKGLKSSNKVVKMSKKKVDVGVGVGADARKKRKELMRLKSSLLHCQDHGFAHF